MRYHFVVNGYADDVRRQMEEQAGFAEEYLTGMEQGEAIVYCQRTEQVRKMQVCHAREAVVIPAAEYVPETVLEVLCGMAVSEDLYIFGNDDSSIELAVRMAARLLGGSVTEASKLCLPARSEKTKKAEQPARSEKTEQLGKILVSKMVYANHMEATFAMERGPYCLSLAKGGARGRLNTGAFAVKEAVAGGDAAEHIVSQEFYPDDAKTGLDKAKVILAAGRGVKNRENMAVIDETARCLGAEVAVSRPAAMNAWKPMNRLIGASGAIVGPDICITAGISGAAAFYTGIEKSRFIIAVNSDEKAPIMKMADVAVVEDFLPIMEELRNICK